MSKKPSLKELLCGGDPRPPDVEEIIRELREKAKAEFQRAFDRLVAQFSRAADHETNLATEKKLRQKIKGQNRAYRQAMDELDSEEFEKRVRDVWDAKWNEYAQTGNLRTPTVRGGPPALDLDAIGAIDQADLEGFVAEYAEGIKKDITEKRKKGGRPRKWNDLWELHEQMKQADHKVYDKQITQAYNEKYASPIKAGKRERATPEILRQLRYERKKRQGRGDDN